MAGLILTCFGISQLPLLAGLPRQEAFNGDPQWMPVGTFGTMTVSNGHAALKLARQQPTAPNSVTDWLAAFSPYWGSGDSRNWTMVFRTGMTVELRTEVIRFNQDDAFVMVGAGTEYSGTLLGYAVLLDRNEIALLKQSRAMDLPVTSYFFWEKVNNLPDTDLTLSVAFTPIGKDLTIHVQVLHRPDETVLWEKQVVDTVGLDKVLANRTVKNLLMQPEGIVRPFIGMLMSPAVGVLWCNTTSAPVGKAEVTIDNVQLLDYHTPHLEITSSPASVALSWLTPLQEHIVVAADQLSGPWCPCPHLPTLSGDTLCMSMPCNSSQKFFKLVPGRQFVDDFTAADPPWWPYSNKPSGEWIVTNGVLRLNWNGPLASAFALIWPPGSDVWVSDFSASVDILDWTTSGTNGSALGIMARGINPGSGLFSAAGLRLNAYGIPGNVAPWMAYGLTKTNGPAFQIAQFPPPYRLEYSGVGSNFTLRVFSLTTKELVQTLSMTSPYCHTMGFMGLWIDTPALSESNSITLDDFFASGTE